MSQSFHSKILVPFIFFTVLFSVALIIWSSLFLSQLFLQKDTSSLTNNLQLIEASFRSLYDSNALINQHVDSVKAFKERGHLYYFDALNSTNFQFNKTEKKPLKQGVYLLDKGPKNEPGLFFVQPFKSDYTLVYCDVLQALSQKERNYAQYAGFILISDNKATTFIAINDALSVLMQTADFSEVKQEFLDQIDQGSTSFVAPINGIKAGFLKSELVPGLYYFIAAPSEHHEYTVVKIVLSIVLVVSLIALSIFIIYLILIKRMTTSIDILRAVSKKVAKGDFNQHIFISSKDEIGELSSAFNTMVNQLKESTATIIEQKEQSDAIISCIPDGIIVTTFKNELILANTKAETIFDFKTDQHKGEFIESFITYKSFKEHTSQLKRQSMVISEFVYRKPNSEQVFLMSSTIVKNEHQKPIGIVYVFRDITQEKQIEGIREGFLRTVSHELRTPLTSVIGFIELVLHAQENPIHDNQKDYLKTALKEAASLKTLIDDLLDFSHIQAGKTKMNVRPVNIYNLIQSVSQSLSPLIKGKALQFHNAVIDKELEVNADETKVRRILVNLVTNAIKFTDKGSITVHCEESESHVEFRISDTGIGLKQQEQDMIFEKFLQVDHSSTRVYEGIGLGLSIVKELVELHKGKVYVESEFGKGSSFIFTIKKALSNRSIQAENNPNNV
jgi:PAS domain S-box-containing protein